MPGRKMRTSRSWRKIFLPGIFLLYLFAALASPDLKRE